MRKISRSENRSFVRINVCDVALAIYLCVLYAHQAENTFEMLLRYGTLGLVILVYLIVYGKSLGIRQDSRLGTGYYAIWASVFMMYAGLSFFWSMDGSTVLSSLKEILKPMLACFAVLPRIRSEKSIQQILRVVLFALAYMLVLLILRTPFSAWGTERVGAAINRHSNDIGRLADLGVLLSLYFLTAQNRHRILYAFLMAGFALCSLLTGSKSAIFIMIVQVSTYFFLISGSWKRILTLACILICVGSFLYLVMTNDVLYNLVGVRIARMLAQFANIGSQADGSTAERLFFIRTALALFKQHPLFGIGLYNFASYLISISYGKFSYSHSGFFELLSTLGIVGFVLYYSMYVWTLAMLFKSARKRNRLAAVLFSYISCTIVFEISTISLYDYFSYLPLMLAFAAGRVFKTNQQEEMCRVHS